MSSPTFDIKTLMPWSGPRLVNTGNGPRVLRKAPADEEFWRGWRKAKEEMQAAGISVGKDKDDRWEVRWWRDPEEERRDPVRPATRSSARPPEEQSRGWLPSRRPEHQAPPAADTPAKAAFRASLRRRIAEAEDGGDDEEGGCIFGKRGGRP